MRVRPRRLISAIALMLALCVIASGCAPSEEPPARAPVSGQGQVEHGHTIVTAAQDDIQVTIAAADLEDAQRALAETASDVVLVGVPIEIVASESGTFVLERTYASPLPPEATATWGYFDEMLGGWFPVPSTLSEDRATLRAEVTHLSLWNDFVSGTHTAIGAVKDATVAAGRAVVDAAATSSRWVGEQFVNGANALAYGIASVFDVRVSSPQCSGDVPDWVDNVIRIDDHFNNSVLWCVGRDPAQPGLLVVKARVNRGFGYGYSTAVAPAWVYNSTNEEGALSTLLEVAGDLGGSLAESVQTLSFGGRLVGAGEEISFGFDERTAREQLEAGTPLVEMELPDTVGFLFTVLVRLVLEQATNLVDGPVATLIAFASCAHAVSATSDVLGAAGAAVSCIKSQDEAIASALAASLANRAADPRSLGASIGSWAGKAAIYLALIGPTQSTLDYIGERTSPDAARQLFVYLPVGRAAVEGLPTELQGSWCSALDNECFSFEQLKSQYPEMVLTGGGEISTQRSTTFVFCLLIDLGSGCTMAATAIYEYIPAGLARSCQDNADVYGLTKCDPDYTNLHDISRARLLRIPNHQHNEFYVDTPPHYRQGH